MGVFASPQSSHGTLHSQTSPQRPVGQLLLERPDCSCGGHRLLFEKWSRCVLFTTMPGWLAVWCHWCSVIISLTEVSGNPAVLTSSLPSLSHHHHDGHSWCKYLQKNYEVQVICSGRVIHQCAVWKLSPSCSTSVLVYCCETGDSLE